MVTFPHDSIVKQALTNLKVARSFLCFHLPKDLQKNINFETLQEENTSFVDLDLQKSLVDVLYSFEMIGGQHGYVHILVEHQRKPERFMPLRLEKYKAEIMLHHVNSHKTEYPPIVYPIVLYNGEFPYAYKNDYYELFADPDKAKEIMQQPFQLIDLTQYDDDTLLRQHYYGIFEMLLKHREIKDISEFFNKIKWYIRKIEADGSGETAAALLTYLLWVYGVDFRRLNALVSHHFNKNTKEEFMARVNPYLVQYFEEAHAKGLKAGFQEGIEKGMQQGMQQGMQEGKRAGMWEAYNEVISMMLKNGSTLEQVSSLTGISLDKLTHILRDTKKSS